MSSYNHRPRVTRSNSFGLYLEEVGKCPLLTRPEEIRLLEAATQGNEEELSKVVKANQRFVISVAKEYQGQGLDLPDLVQAGNLGLIKAATRFDVTRGVKFISYAVWWVRQSILEALNEESRTVRVPTNRLAAAVKTSDIAQQLEKYLGRTPTIDEIKLALGKTPTYDTWQVVSIHGKKRGSADEDGGSLLQVLEDESFKLPDWSLEKESLRGEIELALSSLKPRLAEIIRLYFGLDGGNPLTLEEIGERMGLTRERIRQLKEKALRLLRHRSRSGFLRQYLG